MCGVRTLALLWSSINLAEPPSPIQVATRGCCPRCGSGPLFSGLIKLAPRCPACGLDYGRFNVGDGPAAFLIFIVGAVMMAAALITDAKFAPPWWVHVMLWTPLTIALTLLLLRIAKGLLVALEYRHDAGEGSV
jgi:uncharacterized protein (DUF983 family)